MDAMKETRPVIVDDEHKKIKCDCLLRDDKREEHGEMVTDHKNLAKLVMEKKQSMKENQDNKTSTACLAGCWKAALQR